MKPITIKINSFEDYELITGKLHGRRISRGLRVQKSIYTNIRDSNKHLEVHHEYRIELPKGGQKKSHKIDIVIVDEDKVLAFDNKSKSFNATQDAQKVLEEYQKYISILEDVFPDKKVEYGVMKEEWDNPNKRKDARYVYMNTRGVRVYDTYNFMKNNYGVTKEELVGGVENEIYEEVRVISETTN